MLLPFWLALSASLTLHLAVLMAPGWDLPFEGEHEAATLDATITVPAPAVTKPAPRVPSAPVKKRPPTKASPPATPATPAATIPMESIPSSEVPAPAGTVGQPEIVPVAAATPVPGAVLPAPTFASQWPRTGRIVYQVSRGEDGFVVGQSEQSWTHDATTYNLRAVTETTGLAALFRPAKVVQESRGTFDAAGLRPLEFDTQRGDKPKDSVRFRPTEGRIMLAAGQDIVFVPAVQDLLSLFYQLGALSLDVPQFRLVVMSGRKVANYSVSVDAVQKLDTPLGERRATHLTIAGAAGEDSTEIWLDAESHLPLKIRHRDRKGEVFVQIATHIELGELEKTE